MIGMQLSRGINIKRYHRFSMILKKKIGIRIQRFDKRNCRYSIAEKLKLIQIQYRFLRHNNWVLDVHLYT